MAWSSSGQRQRMGHRRIRVILGDKGAMSRYPLYANQEKALENSMSDLPTTTLTLSAETLPDVQAGPWCCTVNLRSGNHHRAAAQERL